LFITQAVLILLSLSILGDIYLVHTANGTAAPAANLSTWSCFNRFENTSLQRAKLLEFRTEFGFI
jgi:hypothetical protein